MFYERKIKYFDYMVNGIRNGNGGFCKLEARDSNCNITIQVNGLRVTDSFLCPVYLRGEGREKELGSVELVQGRGNKQFAGLKLSALGDTGIAYEGLEGIRIPVSPEREIRCVLREAEEETAENHNSKMLPAASPDAQDMEPHRQKEPEMLIGESEDAELTENEHCNAENQYIREFEIQNAGKNADEDAREDNRVFSEEDAEEKMRENMQESTEKEEEESATSKVRLHRMPLRDNKWEQLWSIYPHIAPFGDEREYLSISPSDFVLLPSRYFRLANNSFLLHGYYNYNHLVLRRLEVRGEERYYIGVPGTFFDREKQVAVMFGFESFECMEEPACTGDYGYYMMKIEL